MTVRSDLEQLPAIIGSIVSLTKPALLALNELIDAAGTGYPTTASGADRTGGSGGPTWRVDADQHGPAEHIAVTSVEATVGRTATLTRRHQTIRDRLAQLVHDARQLDIDIRREIPVPDVKLCDRGVGRDGGVARDGAVICAVRGCACGGWGDPLCHNAAADDRGGLCLACSKREYRYRKAHDLPPRERDVA